MNDVRGEREEKFERPERKKRGEKESDGKREKFRDEARIEKKNAEKEVQARGKK